MEYDLPAIVIDNGSDTCKASLAGDDTPLSYFPSVIAKLTDDIDSDYNFSPPYVGKDAIRKRNNQDYTISRPVQKRQITCWEDMEHLWHYCFDTSLRINPENQPILLTEAPFTDKPNREKMIYTMFEEFKVPAFYVSIQAALILYAAGRNAGVVFDCGHEVTYSVPIYEGSVVPHAICSVDFGGADMTKYLQSCLREKGMDLDTDIVRDIKEKLSYVAQDYYSEIKGNTTSSKYTGYELPDGSKIQIENTDLCKCPETLFHQMNYEKESFKDVYCLIHDTIQKCDIDIRKQLYQNIVLSGGSTQFKGIAERMKKELQESAPGNSLVKVVAPPERNFSTWIGGSILASLSTFQQMWITKDEYEEHGPPIVHRKRF